MEEIFKLYNLFKLKEIERRGRVRGRQESAAEHVYGCLVLAEYFLPKVQQKLDTLKVLRMLVYHDLAEIEAGDTFILDKEKIKTQKEREADAAKILRDKIPQKTISLGLRFKINKTKTTKKTKSCIFIMFYL